MRDLKFRCYYDNKMHKVRSLDFSYKKINLLGADIINFEDGKIMQYTGLKDKNGVEIYEGDIVKIKSNPLDMIGYIIYDEYDLAFELRDDENESQECLWYQEQELEVIGNIYDNPELLKGEQS